jgi:hypothetical protein
MKKFLIKTAVFILIVTGITTFLLLMQDPELIVGRKKVFFRIDENRNYNILVLGSSRAKYSFDPTVYSGPLKIFNMGEDGHGLPSNYLMMKIILEKYHLKIDTLLLEVDEFSFDGSSNFSRQFRDDYFVTDLDDPEVFNAFKTYRNPVFAYTLKIFPHSANLMYSDFYKFTKNQMYSLKKYVPSINHTYMAQIHEVVKDKGYRPLRTYENVPIIANSLVIEQDDREYFLKLIKLCQDHGIRIIFFRAPILECNRINSRLFDYFIDSFSTANKIPYFDFKCQYQWPGQYFDQNHPTGTITPLLTKDILSKMGIR